MARSRTRRVRAWVAGFFAVLIMAGAAFCGVLFVAGVIPILNGAGEPVQSVAVRVLFAFLVLFFGFGVAAGITQNPGSAPGTGSSEREGFHIEGGVADMIDGDGID